MMCCGGLNDEVEDMYSHNGENVEQRWIKTISGCIMYAFALRQVDDKMREIDKYFPNIYWIDGLSTNI